MMNESGKVGIHKTASFEEISSIFANDRFAADAGCIIKEASYGHAVCEMSLTPRHLNAQGHPMGGAIFTLADFTLAIACNIGETPTVAISNTIDFYTVPKGSTLTATCSIDKTGKSVGFYTVDVTDENNTKVAKLVSTCFRRP